MAKMVKLIVSPINQSIEFLSNFQYKKMMGPIKFWSPNKEKRITIKYRHKLKASSKKTAQNIQEKNKNLLKTIPQLEVLEQHFN